MTSIACRGFAIPNPRYVLVYGVQGTAACLRNGRCASRPAHACCCKSSVRAESFSGGSPRRTGPAGVSIRSPYKLPWLSPLGEAVSECRPRRTCLALLRHAGIPLRPGGSRQRRQRLTHRTRDKTACLDRSADHDSLILPTQTSPPRRLGTGQAGAAWETQPPTAKHARTGLSSRGSIPKPETKALAKRMVPRPRVWFGRLRHLADALCHG